MADKGFPKKEAQQAFASSPGLHWLSPIKRNDKRIAVHGMYCFAGMLDDRSRDVLFKKEQVADYWLYSSYNRKRAAKEEVDYFMHHKGKPFDAQDMQESEERFGTVVFESDLDTDPLVIYKMYDDTKVHSDVSV
jgi:hypothetical protein